MEKRAAFSLAIACFNILLIALLLLSVHAQDYPPESLFTQLLAGEQLGLSAHLLVKNHSLFQLFFPAHRLRLLISP